MPSLEPMCVSARSASSKPGVVLGDGCHLAGRVTVKSGTVLGRDNLVMEGTVLGGMPQHIHMPEHPGHDVTSATATCFARTARSTGRWRPATRRASATAACSWSAPTWPTIARSADDVILTNGSMLGGHVTVGDKAYMGGGVGRASVLPHRPAGDDRRHGPRHSRRAAVRRCSTATRR